jgi:4-oxalocrotonate tautomerase
MPHIIVKLWPGKSEQVKKELAEQIAEDVKRIAGSSDKSISVAIEEVAADEWVDKVYEPDIAANWDALYKKPGYKPSDL